MPTDESAWKMMARGRMRKQVIHVLLLAALGYFTVKIGVTVLQTGSTRRADVQIETGYDEHGGIDAARIVSDNYRGPDFLPFDTNLPKKVIVMTYQRCGSSFFGQLFNTNPNVFYLYEPLDSLYSALYGIREGWNVPSDITTYFNGTEREIPEKERRAVATFLSHLLDCTTSALPTETLLHRFWFLFSNFHSGLKDFMECLRTNDLKYSKCQSYTPKLCGMRFGQFPDRMLQCNQNLWNSSFRDAQDSVMATNISHYRTCMDDMRVEVDQKCANLFSKACERKTLRSAKTVRATMHSMEYLLEAEANIRVIHLIRDPRAVVLSRRNFDSSGRSHYAGGSMVREAEVYCRDVVRDVRHRHKLEKRFPGKIMTIIYDDLTTKPMEYAEKIYDFLNSTLPNETKTWLVKNTSEKRNSSQIASKWQEKLSYLTARAIMDKCKTFFQEVRYEFS